MARPRAKDSGLNVGTRSVSDQGDTVPIARLISQDSSREGEGDITVVVGQRVSAPTSATSAFAVRTRPTTGGDLPVATAQPSSSTSHAASFLSHSSGTWTMPGTSTYGGAHGRRCSGRTGVEEGKSDGSGVSATAEAGAEGGFLPTMTQTGTHVLPGCGTASSTGGRRFVEGAARAVAAEIGSSLSGSGKGGGILAVQDYQYVADGGPVLVACGQGKSMYDVKGCLSSWVLLVGGGLTGTVDKKLSATSGEDGEKSHDFEDSAWALRSEVNAAGDGGVTCSACVPSFSSDQGGGSRMLITGGKDRVLREWEVTEGRPRIVAEISGHTDWISGCALIPSTSAGAPPSVAATGGRDGSVRFWSKSASATGAAAATTAATQEAQSSHQEKVAFASGSRSSSGRGARFFKGGAAGKTSAASGFPVDPPPGDGGWSLASCLPSAHGSSEFVTCCATPGGYLGATCGWVATGGTDWSVRLWDVAKSRELGRLSFMGHSHAVRSLASSSDGNLLLSGADDHKVIIWSPKSRRSLATLKGHEGAVHALAVDPGTHSGHPPRWVATGGGEGFLLVWDPRNWRSPVATLRGENTNGVSCLGGKPPAIEDEGSLRGGEGARLRGENGRWEGETTGATMLNAVNCLATGGASDGGEWLFAGGEAVVRSWYRRDGLWHGGIELSGDGLGGIASLSIVE